MKALGQVFAWYLQKFRTWNFSKMSNWESEGDGEMKKREEKRIGERVREKVNSFQNRF